jgi:NAD(P) transhydrogenase subunit beta
MSLGLVTACYLAAAILFILALGGLSNQEKAKRAIWYGMIGMALAVIATIFGGSGHYWLLAPMVIIGGAVGAFVASRVQMTQMPELVAGFHSLVGLAAVFIGLNADVEASRAAAAVAAGSIDQLSGFAASLAHKTGAELAIMRVEIFLGILIGAITFTGSIVAYGKLAGKVDSKPLTLPNRHAINLGAGALCLLLGILYFSGAGIWTMVLVAAGALYAPAAFGIGTVGHVHTASLIEMSLGTAIGAITFTGSVIAFLKLSGRMSGAPIILPMRHVINIALAAAIVLLGWWFARTESYFLFWLLALASFAFGVLIIVPIGGADMPVVISMLNSYSGWAAAGIGFTLGNSALIITGALVGSSGAILSYIMCKGMNRSFISVILGGVGGEVAAAAGAAEQRPVKIGSADDAAYIMKNATKVIIVPGYGMAVAQAQHALREMADHLKKEGVEVKYAIHPVAGRMPGHMNVLLAEANVPYDEVFELEDINSEFAQADIAFVIGANDVTNPAAEDDKSSPIYGMPVLQVWKAGTVMFIKRSLASGYAGIDNPLFYRDNTMMLLGDAKKMSESIVKGM